MNISIVGLFRDSSLYIKETFANLENLYHICNPQFYFYENDSCDGTDLELKSWIKNHKGNVVCEKLNYPKYGSVVDINRFILLSYYRNKAKSIAINDDSDYTLLIDTDLKFTNQDVVELIDNIGLSENNVMSVANVRQNIPDLMLGVAEDSFYDVLPIRDKYNNGGLYFTDCPLVLDEDRNLWKQNIAIKIKAAFSGLSLIRTEVFKKCKWSTSGYVEHINFCNEVSDYGHIHIVPKSQPKVHLDTDKLPIDTFRQSAQQQKNIYTNINLAYNQSISIKLT